MIARRSLVEASLEIRWRQMVWARAREGSFENCGSRSLRVTAVLRICSPLARQKPTSLNRMWKIAGLEKWPFRYA